MKTKQPVLSWVIIAVALPLLITLAWNQFMWQQELSRREKQRIEYSMVSITDQFSRRLQDEFLLTYALITIRPEHGRSIDSEFAARWSFWSRYAADNQMIREIWTVSEDALRYSRWTGSAFVPATSTQFIQSSGVPFAGERFLETDATLIISSAPLMNDAGSIRLIAVIERERILGTVLPALAADLLQTTSLYEFQITDTQTGTLLWPRQGTMFPKPDIRVPLFSRFPFSAMQTRPEILNPHIPEGFHRVYPLLRQRLDEPAVLLADNEEPGLQERRVLILSGIEVLGLYREGSLTELVEHSRIQNSVSTLLTVLVLLAGMIVLAEASRRAGQLARRQQEFIATITHELKTPLAVISSAAQNLTDGLITGPDKTGQYGALIRQEASRLTVSIEHFLLYSSMGGTSRPQTDLCEVDRLVKNALGYYTELIRSRGFTIDACLPDEPVIIRGDRVGLESVFRNLVENALRHAHAGKYLAIRAELYQAKRNRTAMVQIQFKDHGPGLARSERRTVFDPFIRGTRAVSEQVPGNGIGLNLVKRILAAHDGAISVQSRPPDGATFTVILPVYEGAAYETVIN